MPNYALTLLSAAVLSALSLLSTELRAQQLNTAETAVADAGAVYRFNIAAAPLNQAINAFIGQTQWQIGYNAALAAGVTSPGVIGEFTARDALTRLLSGTGLTYEFSQQGQLITLKPIQQDLAQNNAIMLGTVQVTASAVQNAKDTVYSEAASVAVLTQRDIERFRGTSVGDIFQGTTGVLVGENRNSGGLDVNIRGMQGQGRVPVLVDGARQETTVYRGYSGVSSRSYVDPDLIGAVKIEKGPVMSAEGTGATGGVISMNTIGAADIIKDGNNWGLRVRGSAMGNNSGTRAPVGSSAGYNVNGLKGEGQTTYRVDCYVATLCAGPYALSNVEGPEDTMNRPGLLELKGWAGSIAAAKSFEKFDLIAAYSQRQQGNYYAGKNGPAPVLDLSERYNRGFWTEVRPVLTGATRFRAEERIANTHYASNSLLLKSVFYLSDNQSLETSYLRYDSEYGELMPSQLIWLGEIRETLGSSVTADTYTARHHWQPAWTDLIDVKTNFWLTDTTQKNENYSSEQSWGANETENYVRWGADITNTMSFKWAGEWLLAYGLAYQDEDLKTHSDDEPTGGSLIPADTAGRNGNREELSLFTNAEWQPLTKLTINTGVRYTRFESADNKATAVQDGSSFCEDSNGDGECDLLYYANSHDGFAPLFSVAWDFVKGIQLYARYAEALRMPSLFEGTSGFSTSPALDVNLKPEHAKNKEIGLNVLRESVLSKDDKLGVKFAYFRNHVDDYLTRTSPNLWEEGAAQRFFTTRNIESAEFFGAELNLQYDAGLWYLEAGATKYHHIEMCHYGSYRRDKCSDYGIANSYLNNMIPPNWHASATLGARLFEQQLDFGVRATLMGQRNRTPEYDDQTKQGMIEPIQWHAYQVYDLFASYTPNDTVTVDFHIDNLTDQYYLDALSLGLVPAPGRSARLSLTLHF